MKTLVSANKINNKILSLLACPSTTSNSVALYHPLSASSLSVSILHRDRVLHCFFVNFWFSPSITRYKSLFFPFFFNPIVYTKDYTLTPNRFLNSFSEAYVDTLARLWSGSLNLWTSALCILLFIVVDTVYNVAVYRHTHTALYVNNSFRGL